VERLVIFLNSPFFLAFVTFFVGFIAYLLYRTQKQDTKKDAANIIYLEISNAESVIKRAKEDLEKDVLPANALAGQAMQTESWSKYKYLFVRDFDKVEWDSITNFYEKSIAYDEAVKHNASFFQRNEEQIRINLLHGLAILTEKNKITISEIDKNKKEAKKWDEFIKLTDNFQSLFMARVLDPKGTFFYSPVKPVNDAKLYLNNINLDISQSSVGAKLKKIAHI